LEGDVLLCGDDSDAKAVVGSLVEDIPNLRWVDAGGLSMARAVERLTALLISVNKRYGITGATVHLHGHDTFGRPPKRDEDAVEENPSG
jgi:predicted dinucleotide-binding enzyme